MAFDGESKYLYNGLSCLGKDWMKNGDANLPTDVVMKLMIPLFSQGFNVTCDNHFTSLDLLLRLAKQQCSLVATIRANQRKIPDLLKKKCMLHSTMAVHSTGDTTATITSYQCKQPKSLNLLSTLHKKFLFQSTIIRSVSQKPCLFINRRKLVDVLDQISRLYLVKAASRRWPVHIFYNIIDMALINSWVIYKAV